MNEHWIYMLVNLGAISIPFLFSFHPRLRFDKTWHAFFPACAMTAAFFLIWDIWFTNMGVWGFNPRYLLGIDLVNLPIEEWLFFLCIPYACTYTYHCLKVLIKNDPLEKVGKPIAIGLAVVLLSLGVFTFGKWYTSLTFILTAFFLIFLVKIKFQFFGRFFLTYVVILPMFFLTNGILTGSGIEEQVVWYNNAENLGIRMGTIPVEDSMYGLLMLIMNVAGYEYLLEKRRKKSNSKIGEKEEINSIEPAVLTEN